LQEVEITLVSLYEMLITLNVSMATICILVQMRQMTCGISKETSALSVVCVCVCVCVCVRACVRACVCIGSGRGNKPLIFTIHRCVIFSIMIFQIDTLSGYIPSTTVCIQ